MRQKNEQALENSIPSVCDPRDSRIGGSVHFHFWLCDTWESTQALSYDKRTQRRSLQSKTP